MSHFGRRARSVGRLKAPATRLRSLPDCRDKGDEVRLDAPFSPSSPGIFMQASPLVVPEPLPEDGEGVTSALETAAIFNAQGDVREAARWVRRAAEAASDVGADMRALALARAVADLNTASVA